MKPKQYGDKLQVDAVIDNRAVSDEALVSKLAALSPALAAAAAQSLGLKTAEEQQEPVNATRH